MSIRVLLVDQHAVIRAGVISACIEHDSLTIVGEANTLQMSLQLAHDTQPDVIVIDPDIDSVDELDVISRLHDEMPEVRILVFTSNDGPSHAAQILSSGASGYLIKKAGLEEIAVAIRVVHQGRIFVSHSRPVAGVALESAVPPLVAGCRLDEPSTPLQPHLSQREQEVLSLLADGMTNKQAAESLYLSVKTVETYRARIMKKHGLRDRAELTKFARNATADADSTLAL
ncbi:MAG: LuxR C-terminal-related transcriptional regulator [Rubripirellula sp.]